MGRKARRIGEEKEERQSKRGEGYSYPLSNRALQQLLFTYQQLGASIYINAQIRLPMRIYELLVKEGRGHEQSTNVHTREATLHGYTNMHGGRQPSGLVVSVKLA